MEEIKEAKNLEKEFQHIEYMVNLGYPTNSGNYLNYKKEDKVCLISFRLISAVCSGLSMKE